MDRGGWREDGERWRVKGERQREEGGDRGRQVKCGSVEGEEWR